MLKVQVLIDRFNQMDDGDKGWILLCLLDLMLNYEKKFVTTYGTYVHEKINALLNPKES